MAINDAAIEPQTPSTPKKKRKLTRKRAGFVNDYVETGNGTQAALKNYDTEDPASAAVIASRLLKDVNVQQAIQDALPDELLAQRHLELLNSTKLEHMVFPPFRIRGEAEDMEDEDDFEPDVNEGEHFGEQLTDDQIRELLASTNCTVRKIVHGDMARHVYFWAADNKARKEALDMAYKLKGTYAPEKKVIGHFSLTRLRHGDLE